MLCEMTLTFCRILASISVGATKRPYSYFWVPATSSVSLLMDKPTSAVDTRYHEKRYHGLRYMSHVLT
jgi:hypothetical protein